MAASKTPNRDRRLDLEQRTADLKKEREQLEERLAHINQEIVQCDAEYLKLPWIPLGPGEFRRNPEGGISISERVYRLVLEGGAEGVTYKMLRQRLPDLQKKQQSNRYWIYTYVKRLVAKGVVRLDTIGGVHRIIIIPQAETPWETHQRETGG